MSEPFLGQIMIVPYNFAPRGWAFCAGQILPIAQNTALFSLLGTTYGGNGQTTFALPDLRGRVPLGAGQGPGLSNYTLGQVSGTEAETLIISQMPAHTHSVKCSSDDADTAKPADNFFGNAPSYSTTSDTTMDAAVVGNTGGSQPHNNIQPYLTLNFVIALEGIFPSRN